MEQIPVVQLKDIEFHYPYTQEKVLKQVNLTIYRGEWVAIVGHNGSGKSTIAKIMNGILPVEEGEVWIDGEKLTDENMWELRRKVGLVFQNPENQFVGATVEDDIAFGLENHGIKREDMVERIDRVLDAVRMTDYKTKEPARLSGGQKQRVAIAGVIALEPDVIILDEATSMLDPKGRKEVIDTIRKLHQEKNITVISITHDLEEAAGAGRVILMEQGEVKADTVPEELFVLGEALVEKGLDAPFSQKLKQELEKQGIPVPQEYMDTEGLVNWLWESVLSK